MNRLNKKILLSLAIGFLVGVIWLVAIRFLTYKSDNVHYHANFALYIDGQQDKFDNFTFYEEVQSCVADNVSNPKARVHLHNNKPSVVHVHNNGVTWGHFFANLGYGLTDQAITTANNTYVDGKDGKAMKFVLNGEEVETIANKVIGNEDVLVILVGNANEAMTVPSLAKDAHEYNEKTDPSSCAGSQSLTFGERLKKAIGID